MKKTPKKATLQTLDKKIDGLVETVDVLARSTKEGFDRMDTFHVEMTDFKKSTELTLFKIDSKLQTADGRLDAIEKALPPLGNLSEALKREVLQLNARVGRVE